ncbi:MAG: TonB-dependent receptor [Bacteroidales bacterium]|nr:TonB-dependent receptor [Bacteroidales bacterium]
MIAFRVNIISIICILVTLVLQGFSQAEISGYVKDDISLEPLSGANVFLLDLKKGTSTDNKGYFNLSGLVDKEHRLKISYIGYCDTIIHIYFSNFQDQQILLQRDSVEFSSIIVTATRTRKPADKIPQSISVIDRQVIDSYPATNTDDLLKMIPGINVNRSWGIFSRNASVTMRAMPGSARSLILLDGVPLNKTAGGTVNWHLITPGEIERFEVVKGPGSALYGNNAMGGVINIITKRPDKKFDGNIDLGYGTYNTFKTQLNLSGNHTKEGKGLYWKFGGFYRQGDGYILEPEESRDSINVIAYLYEGNANGMVGYRFSSNSKLEVDYRFYKDKRGSGTKVYEKDGSYESFNSNNLTVGYEDILGRVYINIKAFYFSEVYYRQNENVNSSGQYKLIDTETAKNDYGLWMSASRTVGAHQHFTIGLDLKNGSLDNQEIYRTSSDEIYTRGNLLFSALFLQDEIAMFDGKMNIIAGLRLDHARFSKGELDVKNPTSQTGFPGSITESLPESSWLELSPKLALNYFIIHSISTYISASSGFMPPKLDDLAGSRKIRRGFKIANPNLEPETIKSIEWGLDFSFWKKLNVKSSVFYSIGDNFQYLVATGDFIDSGSEDPVPVFQRQNVSRVEVAGVELGVDYSLTNNVKINGSYAYNTTKILEYDVSELVDLTGKELNEVPKNLIFLGFTWKNKIVNLFVDYTFTDEQWYDEENTKIIESYSLINLRLSRRIIKNLVATLDIQDLLNEQFIDRKGYLSPGRFFMFELKYLINQK